MKKLVKSALFVALFCAVSFASKAQTIVSNYIGDWYSGGVYYLHASTVFTSKFTGSSIRLVENVTIQYPNGTLHSAQYVFIVPFTGYTGGVPTGTAIYDTPSNGAATSAPLGSTINSYTFVSAAPYAGN